uniref:Uncharacterized protein n=1 Tax=Trichuris muris TaxID=70415 RepID=A0A5S6R5L3_TRIMR
MPLSRSSHSVHIGRGFSRFRARKLSRAVRAEPTSRSSRGSSLDTAEPTDSTERVVYSEAHALMSQLTSHLSSKLSSFVSQLKEELSVITSYRLHFARRSTRFVDFACYQPSACCVSC